MNERDRVFAKYNWLTVPEVAKAIRRSEDFVRRLMHEPDKEGFQWQGCIRDRAGYLVPPAEVDRYVQVHKVAA